jgi:hypothetical protein
VDHRGEPLDTSIRDGARRRRSNARRGKMSTESKDFDDDDGKTKTDRELRDERRRHRDHRDDEQR